MAYDVLKQGKNAGAVLNAANEVAVDWFLKQKISFKDIFTVVGEIFYNEHFYPLHTLADVNETIKATKNKTVDYIKRMKSNIGNPVKKNENLLPGRNIREHS
jgi:1-deoxy-D-xylulose-5-phosphate reductoisomerase